MDIIVSIFYKEVEAEKAFNKVFSKQFFQQSKYCIKLVTIDYGQTNIIN